MLDRSDYSRYIEYSQISLTMEMALVHLKTKLFVSREYPEGCSGKELTKLELELNLELEQKIKESNITNKKVEMSLEVFQSHKQVHRHPMTRGEYNAYRLWETPQEESPMDQGYLVEYLDGGEPNDARHDGYISWTPKKQFDEGYKSIEASGQSKPPGLNGLVQLEEWQARVIAEQAELNDKINNLVNYLIGKEDPLLEKQLSYMSQYNMILVARITKF